MAEAGLFSISDFAKFSRTTRDTLLHYDRIGLLSPALRQENNYRFYSYRQLAVVNVIRTLQELGMTLEEIKSLKERRTPTLTEALFSQQIETIDRRIEELTGARKLLLTLANAIHAVSSINEEEITIQYLQAEAIELGSINDYSRGRNDYDALLTFYQTAQEKRPGLNLNYPVWALFSEDRIRRGDWVWPDRYYFYNPDGHDTRPAALYAVGYTRGGYGQSDSLYRRMLEYIDRNGFEMCGDAYEEYPLNEVCISKDDHYLMRIMITVREIKTV